MNKKGVSLYIHIPYCQRKCKYCDFVSYPDKESTFVPYFEKLILELEQYKSDNIYIKTVFIGGGTPSLVPHEFIGNVLKYIFDNFEVDGNAEITIECNPCSADTDKLCAYKKYGINRISIGVQSFDDSVLRTLGRLHNAFVAEQCIKNAKSAGFENISVDLMFSIPGQTQKSLEDSLKKAVSLKVSHISLYSLILEDGTQLTKAVDEGLLVTVDDETDRLMYENSCRLLKDSGYMQYEISNFAKSGYNSKHNVAYWVRSPYIGIGCAAHSYFNGERYSNPSDLSEYINTSDIGKFASSRDILSVTDIIEETVMLGLRMNDGFDMNKIYNETGIDFEQKCNATIQKLTNCGFLLSDKGILKLTDSGRNILDRIIVELISNF